MKYPRITGSAQTRQMIDTFRGYNHTPKPADNEFYDMQNLSSDLYPLLSPRPKRKTFASVPGISGMIAKEKLCYVDGSEFVIGEDRYEMGLNSAQKDLVSMGAYVIIMPDKKYINTIEPDDRGDIEAAYTSTGEVTFNLCRVTGELYEGAEVSDTAPENPENGKLWIDTSSTPNALKQYASTSDQWVSIATTYIRIGAEGIGKDFKQYDAVKISGAVDEQLKDVNANMVVWDRGDDFIVVIGILDKVISQPEPLSVERRMPNMDFMCESENRMWGCRYGLSRDGEIVNEIYASKLGDFKNWSCYMGLSTDSYTASCGTDGPFTGAISHRGYPLFFKETCMHKVYGNYPANFQIQSAECRGVQRGCHRSLAVVNEVLYYKALGAVCAYDGSIPTEISYCLGNVMYKNAVGGSFNGKYYISMQDTDDVWHQFAWDTGKRLWHREDNFHASTFSAYQGKLYAINKESNTIVIAAGAKDGYEQNYKWWFETGEIGLNTPDMKYISGLTIRMSLDIGTEVRCFARYDFSEQWEPLFAVRSMDLRSANIPIRPKRCDYVKLRIEGDGYGKIYSIAKTITEGSERS